MPNRSGSYSKFIADKMTDPDFARNLVMNAVESGDSLDDALRLAIRSKGIKEFSTASGLPIQNVSALANKRKAFGRATLERCLGVFGLRLGVARKKVA